MPAPGLGQVGTGLENSWGLEEDVDEEDENGSGDETKMEQQHLERKCRSGGLLL